MIPTLQLGQIGRNNLDTIVATTWNPSDKSASIALTNANLTATGSGTSDSGVRGIAGKSSGKYYVEYIAGFMSGADTGIGMCSVEASLTTLGTNATRGALVFSSGNVWIEGASRFNIGTLTDGGETIRMALDIDNGRVWFAKNGGPWNATSGSANDPTIPSTGYNYLAGTFGTLAHPCAAFNANLNHFTANFGGSVFAHSVPAGFTAGWPA